MIAGMPKNSNNVTCTFFNRVHLLPEVLRFENGGAKLASCPGCNLDRLYVADPMNETMGRNGIASLCTFGNPDSLGIIASELFNLKASPVVTLFFFCRLDMNAFRVFLRLGQWIC